MVVGRRHNRFIHVPIALLDVRAQPGDPHGDLWLSVLESTAQPVSTSVRRGADHPRTRLVRVAHPTTVMT